MRERKIEEPHNTVSDFDTKIMGLRDYIDSLVKKNDMLEADLKKIRNRLEAIERGEGEMNFRGKGYFGTSEAQRKTGLYSLSAKLKYMSFIGGRIFRDFRMHCFYSNYENKWWIDDEGCLMLESIESGFADNNKFQKEIVFEDFEMRLDKGLSEQMKHVTDSGELLELMEKRRALHDKLKTEVWIDDSE